MKKLSFVRSVATAGNVVFSILSVMQMIAAVVVCFSILILAFLPGGTVTMKTDTQVEMEMNFRALMGDGWDSLDEEMKRSLRDQLAGDYELTEDGAVMKSREDSTVNNRSMALVMIPMMTEMFILFFFYRFLAKACGAIKNAVYTPFVPAAALNLKNGGIALFFLAGAPWLTSVLIGLLTKGQHIGQAELELGTALWGFLLLALSILFEYAAAITHVSVPTAAPTQENADPPARPQ